jgi:hypothetical protein
MLSGSVNQKETGEMILQKLRPSKEIDIAKKIEERIPELIQRILIDLKYFMPSDSLISNKIVSEG